MDGWKEGTSSIENIIALVGISEYLILNVKRHKALFRREDGSRTKRVKPKIYNFP